jgi:hypothetical protein
MSIDVEFTLDATEMYRFETRFTPNSTIVINHIENRSIKGKNILHGCYISEITNYGEEGIYSVRLIVNEHEFRDFGSSYL